MIFMVLLYPFLAFFFSTMLFLWSWSQDIVTAGLALSKLYVHNDTFFWFLSMKLNSSESERLQLPSSSMEKAAKLSEPQRLSVSVPERKTGGNKQEFRCLVFLNRLDDDNNREQSITS